MDTLQTFNLDGRMALAAVIAYSPYGSIEQAVAALTVFSHPDTVAQTACKPLVRVVRNFAKRGKVGELNGTAVGFDDNKSPTDVFLWCNGIKKRGADLQFNHVYTDSQNPEAYTCLANICMGPSFLAKLTDAHPGVRRLLEYRAYELYGWHPATMPAPTKPADYSGLTWAEPLPASADVRGRLIAVMASPKNRTALLCRELGWLFGDRDPDASGQLPDPAPFNSD